MRDKVKEIVKTNPSFKSIIFYSQPNTEDQQDIDFHYKGRMNLNKLNNAIFVKKADYYLCGPIDFMKDQGEKLKEIGIPAEKIHVEAFGTGIFSI